MTQRGTAVAARAGASRGAVIGLAVAMAVAVLTAGLAVRADAARDTSRLCPPSLPQTYAAAGAAFTDVPANHTHAVGIYCITAAGITTGTTATTFSPRQSVTRAQMATFLRRMLQTTSRPVPDTSRDVFGDDQGQVHEPHINAMAAAGIIPSSGRSFRPSEPLRRDEMAAWMNSTWRWLTGSLQSGSSHTFVDIAGNPHAASIAAMHQHGVVDGVTDTRYQPSSPVTRSQMGSFLARLMTMHADAGHYPSVPASSTTTTTRPRNTLVRDPAAEAQVLAQHNEARRAAGLPPLSRASCLDDVASAWTVQRITSGNDVHNPNHPAQTRGCYPGTLRYWGENIARNVSVAEVLRFWMGSPPHRGNILSPNYNRAGIGAWRDARGQLWVTVNFAGVS